MFKKKFFVYVLELLKFHLSRIFQQKLSGQQVRDGLQPETLKILTTKLKTKQTKRKEEGLSEQDLRDAANKSGDKRLLFALSKEFSVGLTWRELKDVSEIVRFSNNHSLYESALSAYDDSLILLNTKKDLARAFVGSGLGEDTLNAYRCVLVQGQRVFEKVYRNDSSDLIHLLWFYRTIFPMLDPRIVMSPGILNISSGKKLSVVYFEYIDGKFDCVVDKMNRMFELHDYFQSIRVAKAIPTLHEIKNFKGMSVYNDSFELLNSILKSYDVDSSVIFDWLKCIEEFPYQFSHGDLHGKNLGENNLVIDWDRAGYYPVGFDLAYALSNQYKLITVPQFEGFIVSKLGLNLNDKMDQKTLFSVVYFSMVFFSRKVGSKIREKTIVEFFYVLKDMSPSALH
ncbi:MAG: phosphotransferase [Pseudomonadota bacterium]|nr:phosphotransferase [Pseudomonadota bacterium]